LAAIAPNRPNGERIPIKEFGYEWPVNLVNASVTAERPFAPIRNSANRMGAEAQGYIAASVQYTRISCCCAAHDSWRNAQLIEVNSIQ
jgi:hypothetical protein